MTPTKKPFGLALASKIAADAIRESVAPTSVILSNLIILQKDISFPKDLGTNYFAVQKKAISEEDKKLVTKILGELRSPQLSVADMLEKHVKDGWVIKKAPTPAPKVAAKPINKKPTKKPVQKTTVEKSSPVVTVKKTRFI